jgi:hypothetical protein
MQEEKNRISSSEWIRSGLLEFSHRMIFQPSTLALFSEIELLSLEKDFHLFDNNIYYFNANIPRRMLSWIFPDASSNLKQNLNQK